MFIDASSFPPEHSITTDICILGGGVAGLTLAKEFEREGREVWVLEQGGPTPEPDAQWLLRRRVVGYPYWGLDFARHAQIGGTSHRWFLQLADGGT
jgi:glycine/D-amino acid oxidase-like deaminating enzyme